MSTEQLQLFTVEWEKGGQRDYSDYYSEFVVCCRNEEEARQTHPGGSFVYDKETHEWYAVRKDGSRYTDRYTNKHGSDAGASWISAAKISELQVVRIGIALPGTKKGVILASSHDC